MTAKDIRPGDVFIFMGKYRRVVTAVDQYTITVDRQLKKGGYRIGDETVRSVNALLRGGWWKLTEVSRLRMPDGI